MKTALGGIPTGWVQQSGGKKTLLRRNTQRHPRELQAQKKR